MTKRTIITGGSGVIGRRLSAELLAAGGIGTRRTPDLSVTI